MRERRYNKMASNRIVYTLDFKANFQDVQSQLDSLRTSLSKLVPK